MGCPSLETFGNSKNMYQELFDPAFGLRDELDDLLKAFLVLFSMSFYTIVPRLMCLGATPC